MYPRNPRRALGALVMSGDVMRRWERLTGRRAPGTDCPGYLDFYYRCMGIAERMTRQGATNDYHYAHARPLDRGFMQAYEAASTGDVDFSSVAAREYAWDSGDHFARGQADDRQASAWREANGW